MLGAPQTRLASGLAALIAGLLCLAGTLAASECEKSFYRNTPPQRVSESGLERTCHSLGDGRHFVSLSHPGSQTDVYMALQLGEGTAQGKGEPTVESHVYVPALYTKDQTVDPLKLASPLHKLDVLTAELVSSRIVPRCSAAGGDVYVQSGIGGLSEGEGGVPWSAACCAVPDGQGSFSMGVVLDGETGLNTMSVKELEELVGIGELFLGGCGEPQGRESAEEVQSEVSEETPDEGAQTEQTSVENRSVDEQEESATAQINESEPKSESVLEEPANKTESVLLYVLSSSVSLLLAPLSPVVSTLTNLPSQVCYVLQEDAAVLASLPSDSVSLVQNLGSGVVSSAENVGSVLYRVSEHGVCSLYDVVSTLAGTLLCSCQEGLMGTGTLVGDALGLVADGLGEVWDLGTGVVGSVCEGVGGYAGAVGSEMGAQGWSVGRGVGTLTKRGLNGVWHVLSGILGVVGGVVGNTLENVKEAFGDE